MSVVETAIDIAAGLPVGEEEIVPTSPPLTPAEQGKRFALLVAGVVVIVLLAENFQKIKSLPRKVTQDKPQVAAWATFFGLLYAGIVYQPEAEDPSILITFSAGIQLFTFILFWVMPRKKPEWYLQPTGDSAEFALLMAVALTTRLTSTCRFQGYLPSDATGDGCYQALEALSVFVAVRGLAVTGLTPRQGFKCIFTVALCALFSVVCAGDLNRRPIWDRIYATSTYVEVFAWVFAGASIYKAGPERTIKPMFLLPAIGQACCRAVFWYISLEELEPRHPIRLQEWFPTVIVALHFLLAGSLAVLGLVILCAPEPTLDANMKKTVPSDGQSDPLSGLLASALGAGKSADGLVPVRAIFENGKLRMEYASGSGLGKAEAD